MIKTAKLKEHLNAYLKEEISLSRFAELLNETPEPISPSPVWVKVEDRLPDYDKLVLVFGEHKGMNPQMGGAYVFVTNRKDLRGTSLENQSARLVDANQFHASYVTHWMPLPSKPSESPQVKQQESQIASLKEANRELLEGLENVLYNHVPVQGYKKYMKDLITKHKPK